MYPSLDGAAAPGGAIARPYGGAALGDKAFGRLPEGARGDEGNEQGGNDD
ncbi:MAG: hypothetical protein HY650_01240 [Acidobacteria bacterium]|nr:hypothetical protein [Acidobacteriota bacterium]